MSVRGFMTSVLPKRASALLWLAAQRVAYPPDFAAEDVALYEAVRPFTMTSPERIVALANAVRYVTANRIPGAIVECGVWRGGSMMAAARMLSQLGDRSRELHLFDTFQGMPAPGEADVAREGIRAADMMRAGWCSAGEAEVARNLSATGYPAEQVHLVAGKVEDTIPAHAPDQIAILRLDTDWYESTRHELQHLEPRVAPGGVVIIDDYGAWLGARRAVDEFMAAASPQPMLARIDETGRLWIKS